MDDIRLESNQRFDLLDMNRLKSHIQTSINNTVSKVLGVFDHYSGSSGDRGQKRPLIVVPFFVYHAGTNLDMTVFREAAAPYPSTGHTQIAYVYDKDGKPVGGPDSATSRAITVAAAPAATTRYLQVRRVGTNTTNEPRKFYTKALGKHTKNVNTETIDDWELQENTTSADADATLRDAGWIDVATFQTNGTDDITSYSEVEAHVDRDILTWGTPPDADQDLIGLTEYVAALRQLVTHMRYGSGASARDWTDNPTNEGCFDEEGGFRFGLGDTAGGGLSTVALQLRQNVGNWLATVKLASSDTLARLHSRAIYAQDISPSTEVGFLYSSTIGDSTPDVKDKYITVYPMEFWPDGNQVVDPWSSQGGTAHEWYIFPSSAKGWKWYIRRMSSEGAGESYYLMAPIRIPHQARLRSIDVDCFVKSGGLSNNIEVHLGVGNLAKAAGLTVPTTLYDHTYTNALTSTIWADGGGSMEVAMDSGDAASGIQINADTGDYYFIMVWIEDLAGVDFTAEFHVKGATIHYDIREASHEY